MHCELVQVTVAGIGCPMKSMGWFHAEQLMKKSVIPSARLRHLVEPWFMQEPDESNQLANQTSYHQFQQYRRTVESTKPVQHQRDHQDQPESIQFHQSFQTIPDIDHQSHLVMICGRTADNPQLFRDAIDQGASNIYLEKPGASSLSELEDMKELADQTGTRVMMGFNKNVTRYVREALSFVERHSQTCHDPLEVVYIHNNTFEESDEALLECFSRNNEGLVKNMLIHELCLLVSFHGITADTLQSIVANNSNVDRKENGIMIDPPLAPFNSHMKTLEGMSDLVRASIRLDSPALSVSSASTTSSSSSLISPACRVTLCANRCHPLNLAYAQVFNSNTSELLFQSQCPDQFEDDYARHMKFEEYGSDLTPYLITQAPDYATLKENMCQHIIAGRPGLPPSFASIETAIEALKVAELINEQYTHNSDD